VSAAYQERPTRYAYALSKKGLALGDVLLAFVRWGKDHIRGTRTINEAASDVARTRERRAR
jgi:DNA-binding HxlR family transcriptional regulator